MKNCLHDTCQAIRDYLEDCLSDVELGEEVKNDLSKALSCIFVLEEQMLVKRLVRRAVERIPVPEHLAIEIAERIRNDGRMDALTGDHLGF